MDQFLLISWWKLSSPLVVILPNSHDWLTWCPGSIHYVWSAQYATWTFLNIASISWCFQHNELSAGAAVEYFACDWCSVFPGLSLQPNVGRVWAVLTAPTTRTRSSVWHAIGRTSAQRDMALQGGLLDCRLRPLLSISASHPPPQRHPLWPRELYQLGASPRWMTPWWCPSRKPPKRNSTALWRVVTCALGAIRGFTLRRRCGLAWRNGTSFALSVVSNLCGMKM